MDPVAQYILNSGNIETFPTPHPTPVLGQVYPQSARNWCSYVHFFSFCVIIALKLFIFNY